MSSNIIFISTVFAAGFASFFAPCTFPLIPVYIGMLTEKSESSSSVNIGRFSFNSSSIIRTILFVAGLSTTFIILGFGAGALGAILYNKYFLVVSGALVVILGLHQTGLVKIKALNKYKELKLKSKNRNSAISFYLLGLTFSFGWTPCVGPVLGSILLIAASTGQSFYGVFLMLIYALGLLIPFLIMALASDKILDKIYNLDKHLNKIKIAGGILIIFMGILLMTNQLGIITSFIEGIIN